MRLDRYAFCSLAIALLLAGCTPSSINPTPSPSGFCWSNWTKVLAGDGVEREIGVLVQAGCDIEERDEISGFTPLHVAASGAFAGAVKTLIAAGADVNARATGLGAGYTPLHVAVTVPTTLGDGAIRLSPTADSNRLAVVEMLIGAGADVDARNVVGDTPLHRVLDQYDSTTPALVERLLDAGANPTILNNRSQSPLEMKQVGMLCVDRKRTCQRLKTAAASVARSR